MTPTSSRWPDGVSTEPARSLGLVFATALGAIDVWAGVFLPRAATPLPVRRR